MTHRTVPLDLLVRVRDALMAYHALRVNPLRIGELETLMDDLTAQIEQREGQGEPVAWYYKMTRGGTPTVSFTAPTDDAKSWAVAHGHKLISLYATPQDSVPAWRNVIAGAHEEFDELDARPEKVIDWIEADLASNESRALALAQTKRSI